MTAAERAALARLYPVLQDLSPAALAQLDASLVLVQAPAGQQLFGTGVPCSHYPLLTEGRVRVTKSSPDGHEILLYHLSPGDSCVVTVLSFIGEAAYPAVGVAETPLSLYGVPRATFLGLIAASPEFRQFVFRSLAERMMQLFALLGDLAFGKVDQRLASRLLLGGRSLDVTHQMLADELGTSREAVSRTLEIFQEAGLLRLGRRRIEVLDRDALERRRRVDVEY